MISRKLLSHPPDLSAQTALSDTRLIPSATAEPALNVKLDYLTFKCDGRARSDFNLCMEFLIDDIPIEYRSGRSSVLGVQCYEHSFDSLNGCIRGGYSIYEDGRTNAEVCDFFFALSGKYWERLPIRDQWRILRGLQYRYKAHITRLDGAIDDESGKIINLSLFKQAHELKDFKGVRDRSYAGHYDKCNRKVETLYFGSRQSEKFYRVYRHNNLSRFEVELKRDVARQAFGYLCSLEPQTDSDDEFDLYLQKELGAIIVGGIDFINRRIRSDGEREERHTEQCSRHHWWQLILDRLNEPIRMVRQVSKHYNLSKTLSWIERQVIGSILCLKKAYEGKIGISWKTVLDRQMLLFEKAGRWSSRHQLMLDTFLGERDSLEFEAI